VGLEVQLKIAAMSVLGRTVVALRKSFEFEFHENFSFHCIHTPQNNLLFVSFTLNFVDAVIVFKDSKNTTFWKEFVC
jgi:hypothetical protein